MVRQRGFGCFTFSAMVTGLVSLVIIAGVWLISGGRLFSPGGLNARIGLNALGGVLSHAQTGGNCAACHVSPFSMVTMDDRCQACHTDITTQLQDPHSLHGVLTMEKASFTCRDCHVDHRGATASLTLMTPTNFPHQILGYSLLAHKMNGDSSPFTCAECHPAGLASFDVKECYSCHQNLDTAFMSAHLAAFGTACLACHDGVDSYGKNFNHQAVTFSLTGKHISVDCGGYHDKARSIADLKSVPQDCYSCHARNDTHTGQLGTECGACHNSSGWIPATFDHSKSTFPLTGAHTTVHCQNCHPNSQFRGTPKDCFSCHAKSDAHNGQFGADCSLCHTTTAWLPANFDHSKTGFPLTGAHASLACTRCHVNNVFKGTPFDCVTCHTEPAYHKGLFGTQCDACHSTSHWSPAIFAGPHQFPLDHGRAGNCIDCHPNSLVEWTCYAGCHAHDQVEVISKHQEKGINNVSDCIACHPTGGGGDGGGG